MRVQLGRDEWYLCDWTDQPDFEYVELQGDAERALQWLNQFRGNVFLLGALRRLFDGSSRYDDSQILRQIASRLARGVWRARRPVRKIGAGGGTPVAETAAAFPLEERRIPTPSQPSSMAEPPSFPDDIDPAAIAETQKLAAVLGIPFCEECEKAQSAQQ